MEFYCPPCETAMCQECTCGEHGEHPTVPLRDVVEQHKASLQDQLDAVKKRYNSSIFTCYRKELQTSCKQGTAFFLIPALLLLTGYRTSTQPCRHCQRSCSSWPIRRAPLRMKSILLLMSCRRPSMSARVFYSWSWRSTTASNRR